MVDSDKYKWVNALRGYAILLVILIHSSQSFIVSDFVQKICSTGDLGVQLFFILSSFTLFNSYSKRILIEKEFTNRNFFIRRFFRIAPYYYLAGIVYVFYKSVIKHNEINIENLIANYTFTNGIYLPGINDIPPGGWSIGIEMLFYLLVPVLFKYFNSLKKAILLLIISMLVSVIINHYFVENTMFFLNSIFGSFNKWALYFWLPNQLPVFILGIVLYHVNKNIVFSFKSGQKMIVTSLLLYLGFCFFKFDEEYAYYFIKREYICAAIFLLFAIGTYTTNMKFLVNDFIQKIGVVSFSMYLNHFLIISIFGYFFRGICKKITAILHLPEVILHNDFMFFCFYVLIIVITYFLSKVTYKYVEIGGIDFGNKLIMSLPKKNQNLENELLEKISNR
ncbi:acyltransferase family protein [Flavobacterium sp. MMS24-S5]|uniref:acyltransferase family protein n=1 Tax=Flavobacterium sp. MMS24-S5 TaxID=3416605 RepID=UPI003CFFA0C7